MPTRQQARHEPSVEEGQDSGGNEDIPLATAIPAPVQDALNSIDQRFDRLESLLAGLTTRQTAIVTLHDNSHPPRAASRGRGDGKDDSGAAK